MPDNPIGKVIFLGRIVWLLIILIVYISLFMVMLNSYLQARKRRKKREYSLDTVQNSSEHRNILYYIIVMVFTMLSCLCNSIGFHTLCHIAMTLLLLRSVVVYAQFVKYTRMKLDGSFVKAVIESELKRIENMEHDNPIYAPNSTLDDVSDVLGVSREELSAYIYEEMSMGFSAWISEMRLIRCAHLLKNTQRMISDIAFSTGYCNAPSLTRAFKTRFGKTPSEFRNEA